MSKFLIECSRCGTYHEASTGFFARKILECKCGKLIDVKKDRFVSKKCPHCGNSVVYDQSKGDKDKCPVCNKPLVTQESLKNFVNISCPSCYCQLQVNKTAATCKCPLCDTDIEVQKQIAKEKVREEGLASVIKYEGPNNVLVWKHPIEDFNLGSQLIVHESQEAVFFRDGQALDSFGAGRYTLATQKLPLLQELYKLPFDNNVFHSEVYFVNTVTQTGIKWGTDTKVRMFDPASGLHIELGAYGEFNIRVSNARKLLIKLIGTTSAFKTSDIVDKPDDYDYKYVTGKFKGLIVSKVKSLLAKVIKENNINILEVDGHVEAISSALRDEINVTLEDYGLYMPEFYVLSVVTPDDNPDFRRMKQQYAEQYLFVREEQIKKNIAIAEQQRRVVEAQTGAQEQIIAAQAEAEVIKLKGQASADIYRMQAEAEAQEMKMKGYSYQDETKRQVSLSAMENLPQGGGTTGSVAGGVTGMVGDIVGLGVTLGTIGGVVNMTKDVINPLVKDTSQTISTITTDNNNGWTCACGQTGNKTNFCPNCGGQKPEEKKGWDCECGQKNVMTNFCPNCGSKKPEESKGWDCECGQKNVMTNFCPNCGSKKPEEPKGWDCACGQKNVMTNFCPNCGSKKPEESKGWDCECGQKNIETNFCPSCGNKRGE